MAEMVVAMGITSFVLVALAALYMYSNRSFVILKNHLDLDSESTRAMDRISLEMRQADQVVNYSTNGVVLMRNGNRYGFAYLPDRRQVVRRDAQGIQVLLDDCDGLKFEFFQRTPLPNGEGFYPALRPDLCKVVQLTWESSKVTGGASQNSSALRSAQIVIRNQ